MSPALYHNRYLLILTIIVVLVAGLSAVSNLPRLEDPRIAQRNPTVITLYPGAAADQVESLVTKPIEDELRELAEIKDIESTSRDSVSIIGIELQDWVDRSNNQIIFSKIRDRLADVAQQLPDGVNAPEFDDIRGASAYTLLIALSSPADQTQQLGIHTRLAEELADRLRNLGGTETVRLYGQVDEEITVELDEDIRASLGLTNQQIASLLQAADVKANAGVLRSSDQSVLLGVSGEVSTLQRIKRIPVASQAGQTVYLGDIARITKAYRTPPTEIAFTQTDNRSILVAAQMTDSLRADQWTEAAKAVVNNFQTEFSGVQTDILFEQNQYTEKRLTELSTNLMLGIMVVMLVILVFMGWKPALIVGLALPLSMAATVFSFSFFDQQIHQMSIFGLIIAIGLLIDNAIVTTQEVRKNILTKGMPPEQALEEAIRFLRTPLLASTLTTILGFMPVFLLPGNVGDFISPIAISVVMALSFSFILSLTVIATLAAIVTRPPVSSAQAQTSIWWKTGIQFTRLQHIYQYRLEQALQHPIRAIGLSCILPALGFILVTQLPNVFFPSADRDYFEIKVWLPEDSSIDRTTTVARRIDAQISAEPAVLRTHWLAGRSTPSVYYNQVEDSDNYAAYTQGVIMADSVASANRLIPQLQAELDQAFPEARIVVRAFSQGPPVSAPVAFRLVGPETQTLREYGETIRLLLEQQPGVTHAYTTVTSGKQKLWLEADEDKARLAGLTLADVAQQFRHQLEGITGGLLLEDLQSLPVRIINRQTTREDFTHVSHMKLALPGSDRNTADTDVTQDTLQTRPDWIPASALGQLTLKPEVTSITRRNGERINTIEAFLHPDVAPITVSQTVLQRLDEIDFTLPTGYRLEISGDADAQNEAIGQLMAYLPVLLVLLVATLVLSFKSVILAGLILAVTVLSSGLGFLSLALSGHDLGFNPIIGTAGLIGVAINGSIIVLSAIRANPEAASGVTQAIMAETLGCARHVLSTTLTTVAGFLPLILSGGTFWPPLAIVIAGGVGFSIILSLYFTPAAYTWLTTKKIFNPAKTDDFQTVNS